MAPGPPAQKRKRARPSNASTLQDATSTKRRNNLNDGDNEEAHEAVDEDEQLRPRKRGRPRKSTSSPSAATAGTSPVARGKGKKRAGRPSLNDTTNNDADDNGLTNSDGRAAAAKSRQKQSRPSLQQRPALSEETPSNPRKRGRPSLRDVSTSEAQNKGASQAERSKQPAKRRARASMAKSTAVGQKSKSGSRRSTAGGPSRTSIGAGRRDGADDDEAVSGAEQLRSEPRSRRTSQRQSQDDALAQPASPPRPYTHIAPRVRRVRQSVIESKWEPLGRPSIAQASSILHLAHRPILQRLSGTTQRATHTSTALRLVTHRIGKKISRGLPFPPASMPAKPRSASAAEGDAGRDTELDFESVLDAKQALERQLDPALLAVQLLTREKSRMEKELERDYEALKKLEAGARAQVREHRGLLKKAHNLAPGPKPAPSATDGEDKDVVFRHDGPSAAGGAFADIQDSSQLKLLAAQLGNHVESMRTNLQQTEGLVPQLSRSRAALQDVLLRHLGQTQYEHVVLG